MSDGLMQIVMKQQDINAEALSKAIKTLSPEYAFKFMLAYLNGLTEAENG